MARRSSSGSWGRDLTERLAHAIEAFCARFAEGLWLLRSRHRSSFFFDFEKRLTLISLEVGHLLWDKGGVRGMPGGLLGAASTAVHLRSAASSKSLALRPSNLLVVSSRTMDTPQATYLRHWWPTSSCDPIPLLSRSSS